MSTKDDLNTLHPQAAIQAAYHIADRLQDFRPAAGIAGAALFLKVVCEELHLDLSDVINKSVRMGKDADTFFNREVKALRDYIKEELR